MLHAEVIEGVTPRDLEKQLTGRRAVAVNRKGKHMWFDFDQGPSLMLHFGAHIPPHVCSPA